MSRTDSTQRLPGSEGVAHPDDCGPWAQSARVPEEGCESGSPPRYVASPNVRVRDVTLANLAAPRSCAAQNASSAVAPLRQWLPHPGSHSCWSARKALRTEPASIALHALVLAKPARESALHCRLPCRSPAPLNSR